MCFETGFAVLLDINMWERWAPILIGLLAITIAYWQVQVGRNSALSAQANSIYQQYLDKCINYPQFSQGITSDFESGSNEYKQYRWFFSSMLFSFEQIMESNPKDIKWEAAIKSQLRLHKMHLLNSRTANSNEWDTKLTKIIECVKQEA